MVCGIGVAMLNRVEFLSRRQNLGSLNEIRVDSDFVAGCDKHHLRACNLQDIAAFQLLNPSTLQQIRVDFDSISAIDADMPATSIRVVCVVEDRSVVSRHNLAGTKVNVNG